MGIISSAALGNVSTSLFYGAEAFRGSSAVPNRRRTCSVSGIDPTKHMGQKPYKLSFQSALLARPLDAAPSPDLACASHSPRGMEGVRLNERQNGSIPT